MLSVQDIWNAFQAALPAGISLPWALVFTRHKPFSRQHIAFTAGLTLIWSSIWVTAAFLQPAPWVIPLPAAILAVVCIQAAFRFSLLYTITAGLLASVICCIWRLLVSAGLSVPILSVLVFLLILISWQQHLTLLPEPDRFLPTGDPRATGRWGPAATSCAFCLFGELVWLSWLHTVFPEFTPGTRIWLATVTVLAVVALQLMSSRLAFDAADRIEALLDKQYQGELVNLMQIIRSQRHDFNFHLQTISGMIEAGRYEDCHQYIVEMTRHVSSMNDLLPLRDPAVCAMMNSFQEAAAQKHIPFQAEIDSDLDNLPCTAYEINTVIGNLLQNAIDETEQQQNGWIRVVILKRGGDHVIKVTNPCSRSPAEFREVFRPGHTTKQSHEGIGLATVQRIVMKYGGSVYPEFLSGCVSFVVQIPLIRRGAEPAEARHQPSPSSWK